MESTYEMNGHLESLTLENQMPSMLNQVSPNPSLAGSTSSLEYPEHDSASQPELPSMSGTLLKWTNYIHGWQTRFIKLENGTLSYCKSQEEISYGWRGSINIIKCVIKVFVYFYIFLFQPKPHDFLANVFNLFSPFFDLFQLHEVDECRFDIGVSDSVWYLRASSDTECSNWVKAIQSQKAYFANENHNNSEILSSNVSSSSYVPSSSSANMFTSNITNGNLHRHESVLSLSSVASCRSYKEQLSEMETFRNILYQQIKTLQHYFDSSLQSTTLVNEHLKRHRRHQSMNGNNF